MNTNLEATLSQTLGRALGLPSGASELALARADREQLGTALMHSLTGQNLLSPADVYRIVPRRTWVRRKAEARRRYRQEMSSRNCPHLRLTP